MCRSISLWCPTRRRRRARRVTSDTASAAGTLAPFSRDPKGSAGRHARAADAGGDFPLQDVKRVELPHGLTLLLYEDHRLPIITAQAELPRVNAYATADKLGVGALPGLTLPESTQKHSGAEVADLIESVGGSLDLSAGGGTVRVLAPDRALGLGLLFECLTQPAFNKDDFMRQQQSLVSTLKDIETQPESVAQRTFESLVYGKHPRGRPAMGTVSGNGADLDEVYAVVAGSEETARQAGPARDVAPLIEGPADDDFAAPGAVTEIGVVTGLVGALGGLGGFFPPIVLGIVKEITGGYALGFVLLALSALAALIANLVVFGGGRSESARSRAGLRASG